MKKNLALRIASGLMLSCLLTSCVISGTFAKYVSTGTASDTARVAKWGVTVTTTGSLFGEQYKDEVVESTDDTMTVQVANAAGVNQNVVAPGTQNSTGMTFTLTGAPEVDVNVSVVVTVDDIMLAAGDYLDYTTGVSDDEFKLANDYYPVEFTLTNGAGATLASGNLATIETYLEGLSNDYQSNTDLATIKTNCDGTYKLTWAWAFIGNDQADTYLANAAPLDTISFQINITVTQVD